MAELIPVCVNCSVNALSCKHFETGMSSKTVNLALIKNTFFFFPASTECDIDPERLTSID